MPHKSHSFCSLIMDSYTTGGFSGPFRSSLDVADVVVGEFAAAEVYSCTDKVFSSREFYFDLFAEVAGRYHDGGGRDFDFSSTPISSWVVDGFWFSPGRYFRSPVFILELCDSVNYNRYLRSPRLEFAWVPEWAANEFVLDSPMSPYFKTQHFAECLAFDKERRDADGFVDDFGSYVPYWAVDEIVSDSRIFFKSPYFVRSLMAEVIRSMHDIHSAALYEGAHNFVVPLPLWVYLELIIKSSSDSMPLLESNFVDGRARFVEVAVFGEDRFWAIYNVFNEGLVVSDSDYQFICKFGRRFVTFDGTFPSAHVSMAVLLSEMVDTVVDFPYQSSWADEPAIIRRESLPYWVYGRSYVQCTDFYERPVVQAPADWVALLLGEVDSELAPLVDFLAAVYRCTSFPEFLLYVRGFFATTTVGEDKSLVGLLDFLRHELEDFVSEFLGKSIVDAVLPEGSTYLYDCALSGAQNAAKQAQFYYRAVASSFQVKVQGPRDDASNLSFWSVLMHPAFVNTPLFKAFYDMVSNISVAVPLKAMGILDSDGWVQFMAKHKEYISCEPSTFVTKIFSLAKMVLENIYLAITHSDPSLLWGTANYQQWSQTAISLLEDGATDKEVKLGVFMPYTAFERVEAITEHVNAGEKLLAKLISWKMEMIVVSTVQNLLSQLRRKAESERVMAAGGKLRVTPFAMILLGEPGIGKTTMVPRVIGTLLHSINFSSAIDQIYTLKPGQKHWNGFRNQPAIWLDDVDKSPVVPTGDFQGHAVEVVNVVNTQPYISPQADLSDKGKYYVRPVTVMYTTNHETCNIKGKITDAGPFWRRFNYRVVVHLKEEYMVNPKGGIRTICPDKAAAAKPSNPYIYEIQSYKRPADANSFEVAHMETVGFLETERDFYAFIIKAFRRHYEKELRVVGSMSENEFCPTCNLPLSIHGMECADSEVGLLTGATSYSLDRNIVTATGALVQTKGGGIKVQAEPYDPGRWPPPQRSMLPDWTLYTLGVCGALSLFASNRKTVRRIGGLSLGFFVGVGLYMNCMRAMSNLSLYYLKSWHHWSCSYYGQRVVYINHSWFTSFHASFTGSSFALFLGSLAVGGYLYGHIDQYRAIAVSQARTVAGTALNHAVESALVRFERKMFIKLRECLPKLAKITASVVGCIFVYRNFIKHQDNARVQMLVESTITESLVNKGLRTVYAQRRAGDYARDWVPTPVSLSEASGTTTFETLVLYVKKNVVTFYYGNAQIYALRISGNNFVVPAHLFTKDAVSVTYSFGDEGISHEYGSAELRVGKEAIIHPTKDIAVVHLSGVHPGVGGLQKHFPVSSQIDLGGQIDDVRLLLRSPRDGELGEYAPSGVCKAILEDPSHRHLGPVTVWKYLVPSRVGWCGAPLIVRRSGCAWLGGFHSYGNDRGVGYSTEITALDLAPLLAELVKQNLTSFPSGDVPVTQGAPGVFKLSPVLWDNNPFQGSKGVNCAIVGSMELVLGRKPHAAKLETSVVSTPYARIFEPLRRLVLGEDYFRGPIGKGFERDGVWLEPINAALRACEGPVNPRMSDLEACVDDYLTGVELLPAVDTFRVLSDDETLYGIPGSSIKAFDRTTSTGYPFFKSKSTLVSPDPKVGMSQEFRDQLGWATSRIQARQLVSPFVSWTLKDEPLLNSKVALQNKARVFMNFPFVFNFLVKKYFGPIMAFMFMHRQFFECYAGMNISSRDCHDFCNHLLRFGDRIIDGDAEKYDKRFSHALRCAVNQVLMAVAMLLKYTPEQLQFCEVLLASSLYHYAYCRGGILALAFTVPSGELLTVLYDSCGMSLMMRLAWRESYSQLFRDHVSLATLGDDNIQGVDKGFGLYCFRDIQKCFRKYGMFFTPGDKGDGDDYEYKSIDNASFLKRKFVKSKELGGYVPQLDKKSLVKTLTVYIPGKTGVKDQLCGSLGSVLREAFLYGREFYDEMRSLVIQACMECDMDSQFVMSYDVLKTKYADDKFATWAEEVTIG